MESDIVSTANDDTAWLTRAIDLSRMCPASTTRFCVGAVIVDGDGDLIADGYSREGGDEHVHAEESALGKLRPQDPRLAASTLYTSLEPCSIRSSRPLTCTQLIVASGIRRVVFAWREPDLLVQDCQGAEALTEAGITVVEIGELAGLVRSINSYLPGIDA